MGSVISSAECPHCKGEATEDYYYKTGEVYVMCNCCGYYLAHTLDRQKLEKDGIKLIKDITEAYWKKEERIPVASLYEQYEGHGCMSTITEGTVDDLITKLKSDKDKIKSHPAYKNIFVNWFDGKDHYQFDLNAETTTKMDYSTVLEDDK